MNTSSLILCLVFLITFDQAFSEVVYTFSDTVTKGTIRKEPGSSISLQVSADLSKATKDEDRLALSSLHIYNFNSKNNDYEQVNTGINQVNNDFDRNRYSYAAVASDVTATFTLTISDLKPGDTAKLLFNITLSSMSKELILVVAPVIKEVNWTVANETSSSISTDITIEKDKASDKDIACTYQITEGEGQALTGEKQYSVQFMTTPTLSSELNVNNFVEIVMINNENAEPLTEKTKTHTLTAKAGILNAAYDGKKINCAVAIAKAFNDNPVPKSASIDLNVYSYPMEDPENCHKEVTFDAEKPGVISCRFFAKTVASSDYEWMVSDGDVNDAIKESSSNAAYSTKAVKSNDGRTVTISLHITKVNDQHGIKPFRLRNVKNTYGKADNVDIRVVVTPSSKPTGSNGNSMQMGLSFFLLCLVQLIIRRLV